MTQRKAITFDIKGIKCDNKACGWSDMSAKFDPEFWLNKPCPSCGSNLFTQADYDAMMRMFRIARVFNFIFAPLMLISKRTRTRAIPVEMDGTGIPKMGEPYERE